MEKTNVLLDASEKALEARDWDTFFRLIDAELSLLAEELKQSS